MRSAARIEPGASARKETPPGPDGGPRLNVHALGTAYEMLPNIAIHGVKAIRRRFRRPGRGGVALAHDAMDLRGHGEDWDRCRMSRRTSPTSSETLDAKGVGQVAVVAHSFGGCLAVPAAGRDRPREVERFALLDPAIALPPAVSAAEAEEDAARRAGEAGSAGGKSNHPITRRVEGRRAPARGPGRPLAHPFLSTGRRRRLERDGQAAGLARRLPRPRTPAGRPAARTTQPGAPVALERRPRADG